MGAKYHTVHHTHYHYNFGQVRYCALRHTGAHCFYYLTPFCRLIASLTLSLLFLPRPYSPAPLSGSR
jgi:hypothetical protein